MTLYQHKLLERDHSTQKHIIYSTLSLFYAVTLYHAGASRIQAKWRFEKPSQTQIKTHTHTHTCAHTNVTHIAVAYDVWQQEQKLPILHHMWLGVVHDGTVGADGGGRDRCGALGRVGLKFLNPLVQGRHFLLRQCQLLKQGEELTTRRAVCEGEENV